MYGRGPLSHAFNPSDCEGPSGLAGDSWHSALIRSKCEDWDVRCSDPGVFPSFSHSLVEKVEMLSLAPASPDGFDTSPSLDVVLSFLVVDSFSYSVDEDISSSDGQLDSRSYTLHTARHGFRKH